MFSKKKHLVAVALALATLAVYVEVKDHSFINYDDDLYVTNNWNVRSPGLHSLTWAFTTLDAGNWTPVTWLSHILDWRVYGLNPAGHHITSLVIHVVNVVVLFYLLEMVTGALWRSTFVASLFAFHPINVESVAWVAERKNLLSTLFFFLTIWAYFRYAAKPGWRRYTLVATAFALALMSKSMVVTLPLVLLLLDYWPLGRLRLRRPLQGQAPPPEPGPGISPTADATVRQSLAERPLKWLLIEKAPLIGLAIGVGVVTILAQRQSRFLTTTAAFPVRLRIENAICSYTSYLSKTAWPAKLSVFYPYPSSLSSIRVIAAALTLILFTAVAAWAARTRGYVAVGWLWYVITLLPVIGLVQVGGQAMADRYAYIPLIGVFIVLVWGAADLVERFPKIETLTVISGVVIIFAVIICTRIQVGYWENSVSLFYEAQRVTANNEVAFNNLGEAMYSQGKVDAAEGWFIKAIQADSSIAAPHENLGTILILKGQTDEGVAQYLKAIGINPYSYNAYNKLGAAFARQGRLDEAAAYLNKALELYPNYPAALGNLGMVFEREGKLDRARESFTKAIVFSVDTDMTAQLHYELGNVLAASGALPAAVEEYKKTLKLKPGFVPAENALERITRTGGD